MNFSPGFLVLFLVAPAVVLGINLWPVPKFYSHGSRSLFLNREFELSTHGSKYVDGSGILKEGFARFLDVVEIAHVVDGKFSSSALLKGLNVVIYSPDDQLQFGVDESYKLSIPVTGYPIYTSLEAQTIYGALHGLETLSQLCHFNFTTRIIEVYLSPWTIIDQPRFSFRGLLIDTSRHYQPLPMIKKVIDAMSYTKLNVLHWHIVDLQSFPIEIPSYPKLWEGAYSLSERYTIDDALEVVQYAQKRGISVLAEIDVPGHASSWGIGYPSLWPSPDCQMPLDVSNEFTFKVIDGILSDFSKVFKFRFVHLGGDEVDTSCWVTTPHIRKWLNQKGFNESEAYKYFVLRAQKIALSHGYEPVNWEETFNSFGKQLNPKTVVHNWLGGGVAQKVVEAGLRCIVSNQDVWYLHYLDTTWQKFYMNEPLVNITDIEQQKLVLGGEVCMWGEFIDGSDIEQTIWPRAAAAADKWWMNFGIDDPILQNLAVRILSQTYNSSGCEINCVFKQIHTKRKNRLEHKRLNDLVYTHYNLRLKERQSSRKMDSLTDLISLENIDLTDEWVVEAEEDDALLLDMEVEDWMDVAEAAHDNEGGDAVGGRDDEEAAQRDGEEDDYI